MSQWRAVWQQCRGAPTDLCTRGLLGMPSTKGAKSGHVWAACSAIWLHRVYALAAEIQGGGGHKIITGMQEVVRVHMAEVVRCKPFKSLRMGYMQHGTRDM